MNKIFDDIFSQNTINKEFKNRMQSVLKEAKKYSREEAYKILAADYIRISKEL